MVIYTRDILPFASTQHISKRKHEIIEKHTVLYTLNYCKWLIAGSKTASER